MLIAALRSRSNTAPQQQIWVLVDSDFLTVLPQAEQSWVVYSGATAITVLPYIFPKYCSPKSKLIPRCIANWFGKLVIFNHIPHLKVDLGYKIAKYYRAGRRLYGEVFRLPTDLQVFSSQLVDRFFTIARILLFPLKLVFAIVLKLFRFCGGIEH